MSTLAQTIANLSPEKRRLLEQQLRQRGVDIGRSVILPQSRDNDRFPVSYAQQRLWFLHQLEPESSAYNVPAAVRLQGSLDLPALEQALQLLLARHEALRTAFVTEAGQPYQVILAHLKLPLHLVDLRDRRAVEREAVALELAAAEAARPFDLRTPPLLRVLALRLATDDHLIVVTMHHIIADGWSSGVFIGELGRLYAAIAAGQPLALPPLPIQYADYAVWQRTWLAGPALEAQLAFWERAIGPEPPVLHLPTDRPRPPLQRGVGAGYPLRLDATLTRQVQALSRSHGATLFMTLLAGFAVLLYRYSGQSRFAIGTPVANRRRVELEGLIGCFINTLALPLDLTEQPGFAALLARVREQTLAAFAHQDAPFELLVERLQPERNLSHAPIFQVMFVLQNAALPTQELPGIRLTPMDIAQGGSTSDLSLTLAESDNELLGVFEYNTDLFDEATIARMAEQFTRLLAGAVADPAQPIERLPLLSTVERRQLLETWSATARPYPTSPCLHELIEAQVDHTPGSLALIAGAERLSYAELDTRANQLAHQLQAHGAAPDRIVALALPRSADLVVAILAILKAGAAYLPLDPEQPAARLQAILTAARPLLLLSTSTLAARLPANDLPTLCLDIPADAAAIAARPTTRPGSPLHPQHLAYLLFTSGSTGMPKGVLVEHQNLVNAAYAWREAYALTPADRHLQMAQVTFDVFAGDMVRALTTGGTLLLCPREHLLEPAALLALLRQAAITVAEFVPAVLRPLLQHLEQRGERLDGLRLLICGSDRWSVGEARQAQQYCGPQTQVINSYGLTETTIDSSYCVVGNLAGPAAQGLPIGRPFGNMRLYVLDARGEPVPAGVAGELWIGGAGVARGYLADAALTAERFRADPFVDGERCYRTGDRACWREDGMVELLGRTDQQVKIRGYRIEPGEVEAALSEHAGLQAVAVVVRPGPTDDSRLVAYVVPEQPPGPGVLALRAYLADRLPEYMIPAAFVTLEALPLTTSGKIDRQSLPAPTWGMQDDGAYIAPHTPTETTLAALWAELLGVERVGAGDNFFDLGGHSLLATRLIARIRDDLQVELPLRVIFEVPVLEELAARVAQHSNAADADAPPPLLPAPRDDLLPLSFSQQRLWFLDQLEPGSAQYHIPDAVRLRGALDLAALEQALQALIVRHEILRSCFPDVDGRPAQVILPQLALPLRLVDLRDRPTAERECAARQTIDGEAAQPFDLAGGPLLRVCLIRLDTDEHLLLVTMHHIIADGWSSGVFIGELARLYAAFTAGQPLTLPPLPIQYADYAVWQRTWLAGPALEAQLAFWERAIGPEPPVLHLPSDRPRPPLQRGVGAGYPLRLDATLTRQLQALSRSHGATLFMTLLAGFAVLLYRYSGQARFAIGTPVANRRRAELEGLIGCFINTLALPLDLTEQPGFAALLARVREQTLAAFAHQDAPFELLVERLQPERNLSHTPLFQVMFVLQNAPLAPIRLPDLELEPCPVELGVSPFDLTLVLEEVGDELRGAFEYATDLFDEATIARMAGHLTSLLEAVVADPVQPIDRLPLLSGAERRQLLVDWNATAYPHPTDCCIHELVAAQARRTPTAAALISADDYLSYAELEARANRLAHYLQDRGIGSERLVGLYLERSPALLVSMLAVLKAGGAYLPLDPALPPARLALILADARPTLILSMGDLATRLVEAAPTTPVVDLALTAAAIAACSAETPAVAVRPQQLAYVIYTSGSTGTPRGVLVEHRAVVNHNQTVMRRFMLGPGERVLQFNSISFDAAVEEIFPAWQCGATVVLRPAGPAPTGTELLALVERYGVSVLDLPTAYWHALTAEVVATQPALPPSLRLLVVGGEAAAANRLTAWQNWAGAQVAWMNTYGPTEATVIATSFLLPAGAPPWTAATIPIGGPIDNMQAYVLDVHGEPVPIGVFGELYLGGAGVARGYLNQPELTAERFIADPFSGHAGARLYRTGDLARRLPDGTLEFAGRTDDQIKLRGFRVEPGEVAATIEQHPAVREAVVIARDQGSGLRLVAYIVPADPAQATAAHLRDFLKARLPEYMIPSSFVTLTALPLTANGKLDRRALPAPEPAPAREAGYAAPESPVEQALAETWAALLGVPRVGRHDNFFELGGDSILSIQVIARARQAGLALTPRDLFMAPTIAELAARVGSGTPIHAEQGSVSGPVILTPIQRWFFEQAMPARHHWNQALMLEVHGPLDIELLKAVVATLVLHHDALRMRYREAPAGWAQTNAERDDRVTVELYDLSDLPADAQRSTLAAKASALQASLDLTHGPLLRVAAFTLGAEQPARLLMLAHHLVMDGVSWRILLDDLHTLYQQLSRGLPPRLPPKTTSFQAWAERLAAYANSPAVLAEREYWLALRQAPFAQLPRDFDGANTEISERQVSITPDQATTRALLRQGAAAGGPRLDELLLAALARSLCDWSAKPAVLIELEGHGRAELFDDIDISRTVGWFTTIYPVLLAPGAPDETVRRIREQLRRIPGQGLSYGLLRSMCADQTVREAMRAIPAAEVSFNYLGQVGGMDGDTGFTLAGEDTGPQRDPTGPRSHLLDVSASLAGEKLQITICYSSNLHLYETIAGLAQRLLEALQALVNGVTQVSEAPAPTDFTLAKLDQRKLGKVLARVGQKKERGAR